MNANPFELPRTKIGLGGVRLINVAGATHPESALKARPGMHPKTGNPYGKPPKNTVYSAQAAELLGIRPVSARARLLRHKVRKYYVQLPGGPIMAYWEKKKVLALVRRQAAVRSGVPRGMVGWRQAVKLLGRSRSTLQRHTQKGRVRTQRVRQATGYGMQIRCYYNVADLKKLAAYLRLCCELELKRRTNSPGGYMRGHVAMISATGGAKITLIS